MKPKTYKTGLLALGASLLTGTAWSATVTVAPSGAEHTSIQSAINAAGPDDIIEVAAGTYSETINLNKKVTISGANASARAGANPQTRSAETIIIGGIFASVTGAKIDGVTIQGGATSGSFKVGVAVTASGVTVEDSIIENITSPAQSDGLSTNVGVNGLTLSNSTIRNTWRGIYLNPGSGHVFSGNLIEGPSVSGIGIGSDGQSNFTLTNNTISGFAEGWGASGVGANVVATGNTFSGNTVSVAHYGGQPINASSNYWGSASGPGATATAGVTIAPYYTDAALTNLDAPVKNTTNPADIRYYATLQGAVDAAAANDTLTVGAVTIVTPMFTLGKKLTIQGAGHAQTLIKFSGAITGNETKGLTLTNAAAGTTFKDLQFAGWETPGGAGWPGGGYLVWQNNGTHNVTYDGVRFHGQDIRVALYHRQGNGLTIKNSLFTGTYFRQTLRGSGLNLTIQDNLFQTSHYEGGPVGLEYDDPTSGSITGNTFEHGAGVTTPAAGYPNLFKEDGSLLYTVQVVSPIGAPGLTIDDNEFEFTNSGTPNSPAGNHPIPTAIYFGTSPTPAANPVTITNNGFDGYNFEGAYPGPSPAPAAAGQYGGGLAFNGTTTYAEFDGSTLPDFGRKGTLNLWVKLDNLETGRRHQLLEGPGDGGLEFQYRNSTSGQFFARIHNEQYVIQSGNAGAVAVNWANVQYTWDLDTQTARIYLNGSEVSYLATPNGPAFPGWTTANAVNTTLGMFSLGRDATDPTRTLKGILDDVAVFNKVLSPAELQAVRTQSAAINTTNYDGLLAYWNFDGLTGSDTQVAGAGGTSAPLLLKGGFPANNNVRPYLLAVPSNAVVKFNKFLNHPDSTVIYTAGTGPLDATYNYWGTDGSGPDADDIAGNVNASPYYLNEDFATSGPVRIVGNEATGYPTIQAAINAANPGDTIEVDPGTYQEAVSLNKDGIKLLSTGGSAVTKIIMPVVTTDLYGTVVFPSGADGVQFGDVGKGFEVVGFAGNTSGIETAAVYFEGAHAGAKVIGNKIVAAGDSAFAMDYGSPNSNFVVSNNEFTGQTFTGPVPGGVYGDGQWVTENYPRILVLVNGNQVSHFQFTDNNITGTSGGLDSGGKAHGATLVYFHDSMAGLEIRRNNFGGTTNGGVLTGQVPRSTLVVDGTGIVIEDNTFNADAPAGLTATSGVSSLKRNSFGAYSHITVANRSTVALDATRNYWSSPAGPAADLSKLVGNVSFSPWFSVSNGLPAPDLEVSVLRYSVADNNVNDIEITTPVTYPDLYIAPGQTVKVKKPNGKLTAGKIELAPGGELIVEESDLTIGEGSVISGSFTVFNSFGSWNISGNTTFNIGQSLALISDIHVAPGKTITVNGGGELILDGCVINNDNPNNTAAGTYAINVEDDGLLTIARSVVSDAVIDIDTLSSAVPAYMKSKLYDNSFINSDIEASADAKVYHNLFDTATAGDSNTDATAAFADVDGWGNVTSAGALRNRFSLGFDAPVTAGNTLDSNGNLFVRSGNPVTMSLNVGLLDGHRITGAEALLGYNSSMITSPVLVPAAASGPTPAWDVISEDNGTVSSLGLIDRALGLLVSTGNDGTPGPGNVAKVNFTAGVAGETLGFFRVQTNGEFGGPDTLLPDVLTKDTRLTKSVGGLPSYLTPFTANTGDLVIDNDAPEILAGATGTQVQPSAVSNPVNVFAPTSRVFRNGTNVIVTFQATDNGHGLSGLDAADALNDVVILQNNIVVPSSYYTISGANASGVVTYTVSFSVPAITPAGSYAISATVRDRSGNVTPAAALLGTFTVADETAVEIELEGFEGTTREVVFTATGGVKKVWPPKTVTLDTVVLDTSTSEPIGKKGVIILEDVPVGTTHISAKTAWSLRKRVPVTLHSVGITSANLTGSNKVLSGDITGDNIINTFDYSVLRYNWLTLTPSADIDGDGEAALTDYNLLKSNFYRIGDAE